MKKTIAATATATTASSIAVLGIVAIATARGSCAFSSPATRTPLPQSRNLASFHQCRPTVATQQSMALAAAAKRRTEIASSSAPPKIAEATVSLQEGVSLETTTTSLDSQDMTNDQTSTGVPEWLQPALTFVQDTTGGWGLAYADLTPETPETAAGQAFLWSNLAYGMAGVAMALTGAQNGELAVATEVAGGVSYWYHYAQLRHGHASRGPVHLALLVDYTTAGVALVSSLWFLTLTSQTLHVLPPTAILVSATLSVACLVASWIWESSLSYILWHSLWHILSAYAGYLVADWHAVLP